MLSGILPSLTLHLNETKCATLWGCLNQLNGSPAGQADPSNQDQTNQEDEIENYESEMN